MSSNFAIVIDKRPVKNFWKSRGGFLPIAIVERMIQGSIEDAELFFDGRKPEGVFAVSAHYAIARDGRVWQFVDDEDTAWSNGVLQNPELSVGWLKEVYQENVNCNLVTLSIDYEGYSGESLTPEQYQAALALHRQLVQRWEIEVDDQHIVGHSWIDSLERSQNPGPAFPFDQLLKDLQAPAEVPAPASETAFSDGPLPATEAQNSLPWMVETESLSYYQPQTVEEPAYRPQLEEVTFASDLGYEPKPAVEEPAEVDPATAEPEEVFTGATQSTETAWQMPDALELSESTENEPETDQPESAPEPDYLADLVSTQALEEPAESTVTAASEEVPANFVLDFAAEEEPEIPSALGDQITPKNIPAFITERVTMAEVFEDEEETASPLEDRIAVPAWEEEEAAAPVTPESQVEATAAEVPLEAEAPTVEAATEAPGEVEIPAEEAASPAPVAVETLSQEEAATEAPVETAPQEEAATEAFVEEEAPAQEAANEVPAETEPPVEQTGLVEAIEAEAPTETTGAVTEVETPVQEVEAATKGPGEVETPLEVAALVAHDEPEKPEEKHHWYDKFKALFEKHEEKPEAAAAPVVAAPEEVQAEPATQAEEAQADTPIGVEETQAEPAGDAETVQAEPAGDAETIQVESASKQGTIQAEPATEFEETPAESVSEQEEIQAQPVIESIEETETEPATESVEIQAEPAAEAEEMQAESAPEVAAIQAESITDEEEIQAEPVSEAVKETQHEAATEAEETQAAAATLSEESEPEPDTGLEAAEPAIEAEDIQPQTETAVEAAEPAVELEETQAAPAVEAETPQAEPAIELEALQSTPALEVEAVQTPPAMPVSRPEQPEPEPESFYPFELDTPPVSNHAAFYRSQASDEPAGEINNFTSGSDAPVSSFEQDYDFQDLNGPSDYPFELPAAEVRPQPLQPLAEPARPQTFDTAAEKPAQVEETPPMPDWNVEPAEVEAPANVQSPDAGSFAFPPVASRDKGTTNSLEAAVPGPHGFAYDDLELPSWLDEAEPDLESTSEPASFAGADESQYNPDPVPTVQTGFAWASSPYSQDDVVPGWLQKPAEPDVPAPIQAAPVIPEQAAIEAPTQTTAAAKEAPAVALPNQDWQENLFEDDDFFSLLNQSGLDLNVAAPTSPAVPVPAETDSESGPLEPSAEELSHFEQLLSESGASQPAPAQVEVVPPVAARHEPEFASIYDEVEPPPSGKQTLRQLIDRNDGYTAPLSYEDLDMSVPFGLEEDITIVPPHEKKPLVPAQDRKDGLSLGEDFFEQEPFPEPVAAAPIPAQVDPPGFNRVYLGGGVVSVELANIRSQPSYAKETVLKVAEQGERFEFDGWTEGPELRNSTRWYHIAPADGSGWIHSTLVALDRPFRV